jgi:UDP-3-O-[3-hydroxymyristoyl] glucosamine N-acyltransferase
LGGRVEGDGSQKIHQIAKIQEGVAGAIAFLSNQRYEPYLYTTQATAVLIDHDLDLKQPVATTLIRVENAYTAFSSLLEEYQRRMSLQKTGVEQPSFVHESATLEEGIYLGAFAYIGAGCKIGKHCKIYPHAYIGDNTVIGDYTIIHSGVKIYPDTQIGSHCTLHSGVVVGSDGFGFAPQADGTYKTIPQVGNVIIEDHVDIGANTVIDCATMGSTVIESGVKLDNLIQVAHNVRIGAHTVVAAQAGISGSATLGKHCVIAGQVGVVGHLSIADRTTIGAQSGISRSVKEQGTTLLGSPGIDHKEQIKALVVFRKLPEMKKKLDLLEQKISKFDG